MQLLGFTIGLWIQRTYLTLQQNLQRAYLETIIKAIDLHTTFIKFHLLSLVYHIFSSRIRTTNRAADFRA
jgi:hypothetical protein